MDALKLNQKVDLLHSSCKNGKVKKVQELMECADVELFINQKRGIFLYTPLHYVTVSNSSKKKEILELLLNHGADVSSFCNGWYTPLHLAANIGDVECIKILLQYNADVTLTDEFGKTPLKTAENSNRKNATKHLRSAELKLVLRSNFHDLKKMIDTLRIGTDITDTCFNECLEIAVEENLHLAAGFIIFRSPDNIVDCLQKAIHHKTYETAAMLLLCKSAIKNDAEMIDLLCKPMHLYQPVENVYRSYSLTKSLNLNGFTIDCLRTAVKNIDHAFPVSLACRERQYGAVKSLLFNLYLNTLKRNVDWHGLALNTIQKDWIEEVSKFQKLDLSYNYLKILPSNMTSLKCLKRLDLQHNKLEAIPIALFQDLPSLKTLNLQYNRISALPNILKWSPVLTTLNLQYNHLKAFPDVAGALIESLNLANNRLNQFPECICNLKTLSQLDISGNREITELPLQVGKLKNLVAMNLSGLLLIDIPQQLLTNAKSLVRYMGARLRAARTYCTMKLMLIGRTGIGKTTLMHRLKGEENFNTDLSTTGIDIQEISIRKGIVVTQTNFTFRVWDFAGQEDYYATHQCFLSDCSIYLLLWDMQLKEQGLLQLEPWLDTLSARVTNCSVIIVGTKLDLVKTNDIKRFRENMNECAERLVMSKSIYSKLRIRACVHVTSNIKHKEYYMLMDVLTTSIYDSAENMTDNGREDGIRVMGEKIPLSYLLLEKYLDKIQKDQQRENKLPMIDREEFLGIMRNLDCDKDALEEEELDDVTMFLQKAGTILHYDDPHNNLKDLYFINPSWLCRLLAKVITVKAVHNFFDEKGILKISDIRLIIGEQNEDFPVNFYPKYLRLLYRFQIACRIDEHRLLVPSKLPDVNPKKNGKKISEDNLLTRYHFFLCIPYGFWSRFISRLLLLLHEMLTPNTKKRDFSELEMSTFSAKIDSQLKDENDYNLPLSTTENFVFENQEDSIIPNVNGNMSPGVVFVKDTRQEINHNVINVNGHALGGSFASDSNDESSTCPKSRSCDSYDISVDTNSHKSFGGKYPVPDSSSSGEFSSLPFDYSTSDNNNSVSFDSEDCLSNIRVKKSKDQQKLYDNVFIDERRPVGKSITDDAKLQVSNTNTSKVKVEGTFKNTVPSEQTLLIEDCNLDHFSSPVKKAKFHLPIENSILDHPKLPNEGSKLDQSSLPNEDSKLDYPNLPIEDSKHHHPNLPDEDSNLDHLNLLIEDSNLDHSNLSNEDSKHHHSNLFIEDSKLDHSNLSIEDSKLDHSNLSNEDSKHHHPNLPNEDSKLDHSNLPNEDSNLDHSNLSNEDSKHHHPNLPIEDSKLDHSNLSIEDSKLDHPNLPNEDSNLDHSNLSNEDSNLDHSNLPDEDSNLDHPNLSIEGSKLHHPNLPNDGTNLDHPNLPIEDSKLDHSNLPNEDSNLDHSNLSNEDSNLDHSNLSIEDSKLDHPNLPIEDSKLDHSNLFIEGSKLDHSNLPIEDSNLVHSNLPIEDSKLSHSNLSIEGSKLDHPNLSKENSKLDYPKLGLSNLPNEDSKLDQPNLPIEDSKLNHPNLPIEDSKLDHPNLLIEDSKLVHSNLSNEVSKHHHPNLPNEDSNLDHSNLSIEDLKLDQPNSPVTKPDPGLPEQNNSFKPKNNPMQNVDLFSTPIDIACLIDKEIVTCWKDGIIFDHPQLYFSVQQIPSMMENRQTIETKVSKTALGYRVLGFVVDHIKTLIKEWFNNLSGTDGKFPYVMQYMPCPVCMKMNIDPPHMFDVQQVFKRIYCEEKSDLYIQCERRHKPQVIKVNKLCPELLFEDIHSCYQLDRSKLILDKSKENMLGKGGYGEVYSCVYNSRSAAVKIYNFCNDESSTFETFVDIRQEISMLTKLKGHPFIVEFLGFSTQPKLCAVMELAEKGTLKNCLYGEEAFFDRILLYRIVLQVATALEYMHSKNIIHRDIKSDNILLFSIDYNAKVNVKVTDFGTTNFTCPTGMRDFVGTAGFIAPEIYDAYCKDEYTSKIDVYSLAMVIYEIVTRRRPFFDCECEHVITTAVTRGERPKYKDVRRSLLGLYTLTEAMLEMWHQDGFKRPNTKEICDLLKMPVFMLLYGKRALELPQNPRFMCYVPSSQEMWVICDDRKGAYVIIYNVISGIVETLTIDGTRYDLDPFNLVHISLIDDMQVAIVLRGTHDVMLSFSTDRNHDIVSYHVYTEEHISSIDCSKEHIFIGFQSGLCSRIPKIYLLDKKVLKDIQSVNFPNQYQKISSVVVNEHFVVVTVNRDLYQFENSNLTNALKSIRISNPDQPIREMVLSYDRTKLFVSFQSSPIVLLIHIESLSILSKFNCTSAIKQFNPEATKTDIRITCMCSFADVLWIGNGSGHILIIEHNNCSNVLSYMTGFQPYMLETRTLCLAEIKETNDGTRYLILSSGKTLNNSMFGTNSFCKIEPSFPIDKAYTESDRASPFQPISVLTDETKVILIWQGFTGRRMRNILQYEY